MKKTLFFFIFLSILSFSAFAQKGYFFSNDVINNGVNLIDDLSLNFRYCQVVGDSSVTRYKPGEVDQYGFDGGDVYKAFDVTIKSKTHKYFLKWLVQGKVNLYCLKAEGGIKRFYINGSDSTILEELTSKNYKLILENYIQDNVLAGKHLSSVRLMESDLVFFLKEFNRSTNRSLQRIQFGFRLGAELTQPSSAINKGLFSYAEYPGEWNLSGALLMKIPIDNTPCSIVPELAYKTMTSQVFFDNSIYTYVLMMDYSTVDIPLLVRYEFSDKRFSPFLQAGPLYSRIVRNHTAMYEYEVLNNVVNTRIPELTVLAKNRGGFSVGGGVEYKNERGYGFIGELRFSQLYNMGRAVNNLNFNEVSLTIGILF